MTDIREVERKLQVAHKVASDAVRAAELTGPAEVVLPAVSEIRFAAGHLVCALSLERGSPEWVTQLQHATEHLHRASFDARQASALHVLLNLRQFLDDYRLSDILEVAPDYSETLRHAEQLRASLVATRDHGGGANIASLDDAMRVVRDDLSRMEQLRRDLNRRTRIRLRQTIAMLLAGLVSSAVASAVALWLAVGS